MKTSADVLGVVRDRLERRGTVGMPHPRVLEAIVWETLAVLGDWELIQLDSLEGKDDG